MQKSTNDNYIDIKLYSIFPYIEYKEIVKSTNNDVPDAMLAEASALPFQYGAFVHMANIGGNTKGRYIGTTHQCESFLDQEIADQVPSLTVPVKQSHANDLPSKYRHVYMTNFILIARQCWQLPAVGCHYGKRRPEECQLNWTLL